MILDKETKDPKMRLTLTYLRTPSPCLMVCLLVWLCACGLVQAQSIHPYRTPQAIALTSQLLALSPLSNSKLKLSLSDWIQTVAVGDPIPLWLDRRIPSDIMLSIDIPKDQTNKEVLALVAAQIDAEIACVDRYVALVPKGSAGAIEWAYWSLCSNPSQPAMRVTKKEGLEWSDGTDTRQIWKSFTEQYRLTSVSNSSRLVTDFDRWRAGRLDFTNPAAIATLLLCGFDEHLNWQADKSPRIELLSESFERLRRTPGGDFVRFQYASEIPKIGKNAWQAWRTRWPQATFERVAQNGPAKSDSWEILAPVAAHRELVESLAPPVKPKPANPNPSNPASTKKYTGVYRGEILKILASLSQQLSLQLIPKDLSTSLARQEVDVSFKDATLEELLGKLADASGLKITLEGQSLVVQAPER